MLQPTIYLPSPLTNVLATPKRWPSGMPAFRNVTAPAAQAG